MGILLMACMGQSVAQGLSFSDAIAIASRDAPAIAANKLRIEAARQAAIPAGALPDPKLLFGIDNLPIEGPDQYSLSRDFMTMQRIGLMQEFPNRAKRDARVASAQGRISVAEAQSRITRLNAVRQTALGWIARETAERQLALVDALVAENRLFEAAVRARMVGGRGMAVEAIAARQEAAAIEERRDELRSRREQAIATLREWIGPEAAESPLSGEAPDWPVDDSVLRHGVRYHPEFALFDANGRSLDAAVSEALAAKRPDWSIEVAYQRRGPLFSNMVSVLFSIDLPVFPGSRQDPQIAEKRAERLALDSEREAGLREHARMLEAEVAEYHRLGNAVERQRNVLLPLAEERISLALADWRGGRGSLADVVAARSQRIDARLKLIALDGERQQIAASLHYAYSDHAGAQP
jgi:outer membrane protein TolC